MIHVLARGREQKTLQVRRDAAGTGYELLITEDERVETESFQDLPGLLLREHQLVTAWRAAGWREVIVPDAMRPARRQPQLRLVRGGSFEPTSGEP